MTISERMFLIFEEQEKKPADLCRILNIHTSVTSGWKTRNADPPAKYIPIICEFLNVTIEYLLTGEGPKTPEEQHKALLDTLGVIKLTAEEERFLAYYKKLSLEQKAEIRGEMKAYAKLADKEN